VLAWFTAMMAVPKSTEGAQPEMVPSSVANRNAAAADLPACATAKSVELGLNTCPVGLPVPLVPAAGIVTTRFWIAPVPSYSVVRPVALSDTQNAPVGL
jgi:hypothetical protein